jgi:ABC-type branched-subunit amino acid transport system substrate-binding protein
MTMTASTLGRRVLVAAALTASAGLGFAQAPSGQPVRIGSTLALTGPLSATAQIHRIVGEIYVEQLNRRGGLLGRPVEWVVKDDQSKPDLARTLYEQLVTAEKVDLLMGPTPPAPSSRRWAWPSATTRCSCTTRWACRRSPSTTWRSPPGRSARSRR